MIPIISAIWLMVICVPTEQLFLCKSLPLWIANPWPAWWLQQKSHINQFMFHPAEVALAKLSWKFEFLTNSYWTDLKRSRFLLCCPWGLYRSKDMDVSWWIWFLLKHRMFLLLIILVMRQLCQGSTANL